MHIQGCFIYKMMTKLMVLYLIVSGPLLVYWEVRASLRVSPSHGWYVLPTTFYTTILGFACFSAALRSTRPMRIPGRLGLKSRDGSTDTTIQIPPLKEHVVLRIASKRSET